MKRIVETCLLALVLIVTLAASASAEAPESPQTPARCATGEPELLWLTGGGCNQSFCQTEEQCWTSCPEALAVACVGGVCQYTLPPGGGTGNNCSQSFCSTDEQCTCKDGTLRQCIGNICV